ncbi:hypothetical protein ELR50_22225 [Pseudomonas citronellolis]|uniref:hypothetical protein n=1 Tax=Pseudomonas citronellolis TaxID=53408 RepID=UPI0022BA5B99|nr:hypothetical protein [Pseudomonas citronellolis]WBG65473.1 hypothetical protein ELR50_22225 [Pseudomonas citronellolis]
MRYGIWKLVKRWDIRKEDLDHIESPFFAANFIRGELEDRRNGFSCRYDLTQLLDDSHGSRERAVRRVEQGDWLLISRNAFSPLSASERQRYHISPRSMGYLFDPPAPTASIPYPLPRSKPGPPPQPLSPELIAVAGSQHDDRSGNKMMFIGQAVRELAEFQRNKPRLSRTLVVFTAGYSAEMLASARESAELYRADFVTVQGIEELFRYLNQGKDRKQSPIEHLALFSHGVPQRIAFGHELADESSMDLSVLNYRKLSPAAFADDARLDSHACRTGMGNQPNLPIEEAVQFYPQTRESLAQLLANHLRVRVRAYIRRSDYKNTWGSFEERRLGELCGVTDGNAPSEVWCKEWKSLFDERKALDNRLDYTYQISGAINPVISGTTPYGVPGGHIEFRHQ